MLTSIGGFYSWSKLEDCEFHGRAVEAVDVVAGSVTLEVETVFLSASGDDNVVNQFAVDAKNGEVGVERHVDGNHDMVGGRVGIGGRGGEGGVIFDTQLIWEYFVPA